ncbi:hypothetical protein [Porphyromonas endodontalis]
MNDPLPAGFGRNCISRQYGGGICHFILQRQGLTASLSYTF